MKFSTILWITLAAVGLLEALNTSAIFFGLFTTATFLTILDLTQKKTEAPQTEQPILQQPTTTTTPYTTLNTCPNCGKTLDANTTFCPQCGEKVKRE